jgi:nucleotide-binding universal stress UspA family protein
MINVGRKTKDRVAVNASENIVPYRRILVPVHGTEADKRAIELATLIGTGKNAEMVLVYVVEVAQSLPLEADMPSEVDTGEDVLQGAERWARQTADGRVGRISPELLQARSAGAAIVDEAIERGADVIVMALCNHMRHGQPTPGETVPYVMQNAPCEVVVARVRSGCDR